MSPVRLHDAMKKLNRARAVLFSLFEVVEFLATPTAPQLAFPRTQPAPTNQAIFTGLANIYGGPAISLPSAISDEGLPLAFHLMAAPNQEAHLLNAKPVEDTGDGLFPRTLIGSIVLPWRYTHC